MAQTLGDCKNWIGLHEGSDSGHGTKIAIQYFLHRRRGTR